MTIYFRLNEETSLQDGNHSRPNEETLLQDGNHSRLNETPCRMAVISD